MLKLTGVTVRFGALTALESIDLTVAGGEHLAVLGPSGSGKSTLLRAIAGLQQPSSGTVSWDGHDLTALPVHVRGFGLMFQDYALFPHRDVAGNVGFALEMAGAPTAARRERVEEMLELVGLAGYGPRRVTELSGGEQQRVALARVLLVRPDIVFLDEATSALDEVAEAALYRLLREAEWQPTIVSVGHHGTLKRFHETVIDLGPRPASAARPGIR